LRRLTGLLPAYIAVLIAAPPHPIGICEFGEGGEVSIGTGSYRLRVQMRELREISVLAGMDNAQLPVEVVVVWNVGHAACLNIVDRNAGSVVARDATGIGPYVHVPDRALTAVMDVDPQHLARPAKPRDLHLRNVGDCLPRESACLQLVCPSLLRIRPGGCGC